MVSVRSVTTSSRTPAGSECSSWGRAARMSATVCTMLAPGWRWMSRITAGLPLRADTTRSFSTPAITVPTSFRRRGAASL